MAIKKSNSLSALFKKLRLTATNPGALHAQAIREGRGGATLKVHSPIDGALLAKVTCAGDRGYEEILTTSQKTFLQWRSVPAPKRGEVIRLIAQELRAHKEELGELITLEVGKIRAESLGEVQEAIDIADFAVGLSRQLYGLSMHSERPQHRMYEQWHPLGPVGVITAFNFPVAVWAWNACLAAVCGDTVIWKPSELAPLSALATHQICAKVAAEQGFPGLFSLLIGDGPELGKRLAADRRVPLISATGSCRMGRAVGQSVAARFGKSLLELGGNNAVIVLKDADQKLALRSLLFGAVGTAGQRCTTARRLLIEKSVATRFLTKLVAAYRQIPIGDPRSPKTLLGPLIHQRAVQHYTEAIKLAVAQGGKVLCGGRVLKNKLSGQYVEPTIIEADHSLPIVHQETFAPILYVSRIRSLTEAIEINNEVPQGLSSALFTKDLRLAEKYLSAVGSDCGIANVNIGTSGAEIGGAFGGEKETGGGRESGSDAWRQYMRRQTSTINFGDELPLAQGVKFDL